MFHGIDLVETFNKLHESATKTKCARFSKKRNDENWYFPVRILFRPISGDSIPKKHWYNAQNCVY